MLQGMVVAAEVEIDVVFGEEGTPFLDEDAVVALTGVAVHGVVGAAHGPGGARAGELLVEPGEFVRPFLGCEVGILAGVVLIAVEHEDRHQGMIGR